MAWVISVVEDDVDIREHLAEVLRARGFKVVEARHGAEVLDLIRSRGTRPALMVLDLMMPVMDGWTLLKEQPNERLLDGVPIVLITAHEPPATLPPTVQAVFQKPFVLKALLEAVRHICADLTPPERIGRGTDGLTRPLKAVDPDDPEE